MKSNPAPPRFLVRFPSVRCTGLAVLGFAPWLLSPASHAAPYASAVTVTGDNVGFILNESADSVKVFFDGGTVPTVIGASPEPAGPKTFSKTGHTSFRIEVEKNAGPGWKSGVLQQISQDSNDLVKFANGRGLAINRHPGSGKYFGRIYASVGTPGNAVPLVTPAVTPRNAMAEGIYVLNPDLTATSLGSGALTGGLTFDPATGTASADLLVTNGTDSPYRLTVGEDGHLFISDFSKTKGTLYKSDPDVAVIKNVFDGNTGSVFPIAGATGSNGLHGSIAAAVVEGSEANGNLEIWVIDQDLQSDKATASQTMRNSIWKWTMGGDSLPLVNAPVRFANTAGIDDKSVGIGFAALNTCDLARSSDGTFYKLQRRSAGAEGGIFAVNSGGSAVISYGGATKSGSLFAYRAFSGETAAMDPFLEAGACDISADNWLAVLRRSDNAIHLVRADLGLIDFSTHILLYPKPTTAAGRDIAFDAAGNLYSLSSGQALLRVYAPGGHTLANTTSEGTFDIMEVTPPVPAAPLEITPVVTAVTRSGNDLTMSVFSRLGLNSTMALQRTTDPANPWETSGSAGFPAAQFSITGDPPNFTLKAIGAFPANERFFFRARRN